MHFTDLCGLLGEPTPTEADPTGEHYSFERGGRKDTGGDPWVDAWKRRCFGAEHKGNHADIAPAFDQLRQYALAPGEPNADDRLRKDAFRIRTNWTNSVTATHDLVSDDLVGNDPPQAQMEFRSCP